MGNQGSIETQTPPAREVRPQLLEEVACDRESTVSVDGGAAVMSAIVLEANPGLGRSESHLSDQVEIVGSSQRLFRGAEQYSSFPLPGNGPPLSSPVLQPGITAAEKNMPESSDVASQYTSSRDQIKFLQYTIAAWSSEGIAEADRPKVWRHFLKPSMKRLRNASVHTYDSLLSQSGDTRDVEEEIEKDVARNWHIVAHNQRESAQRVLLAYARRNKSVGYCQGMDHLVSVLLLYLKEEEAFWALAIMVEILVPDYHNHSMRGMQIDQRALAFLLEQRRPELARKLKILGLHVSHFSTRWFISLFASSLSSNLVSRVWDTMLSLLPDTDGAGRVILGVSVTILLSVELPILQATEPSEVRETIDRFLEDLRYRSDSQQFLQWCFAVSDSIPAEQVRELRAYFSSVVQDDMNSLSVTPCSWQEGELSAAKSCSAAQSAANTENSGQNGGSWFSFLQKKPEWEVIYKYQDEIEIRFHTKELGVVLEPADHDGVAYIRVRGFRRTKQGKHGPARRCKLIRRGDILISLNGRPTQGLTIHDVQQSVLHSKDKPITMCFRKSDQNEVATIMEMMTVMTSTVFPDSDGFTALSAFANNEPMRVEKEDGEFASEQAERSRRDSDRPTIPESETEENEDRDEVFSPHSLANDTVLKSYRDRASSSSDNDKTFERKKEEAQSLQSANSESSLSPDICQEAHSQTIVSGESEKEGSKEVNETRGSKGQSSEDVGNKPNPSPAIVQVHSAKSALPLVMDESIFSSVVIETHSTRTVEELTETKTDFAVVDESTYIAVATLNRRNSSSFEFEEGQIIGGKQSVNAIGPSSYDTTRLQLSFDIVDESSDSKRKRNAKSPEKGVSREEQTLNSSLFSLDSKPFDILDESEMEPRGNLADIFSKYAYMEGLGHTQEIIAPMVTLTPTAIVLDEAQMPLSSSISPPKGAPIVMTSTLVSGHGGAKKDLRSRRSKTDILDTKTLPEVELALDECIGADECRTASPLHSLEITT